MKQVFKMPESKKLCGGLLVNITFCEDRGDFYYVGYRPIKILDGKCIQSDAGHFGAARINKNGPKPERQPIFLCDAPKDGAITLA